MTRGTTPTEVYTIPLPEGVKLSQCTQIWVTISDRAGINYKWDITRLQIDDENNKVSLTLTQAETLAFAIGRAKVQVRLLFNNGSSAATLPVGFEINDVKEGGVIE